MKKIKILTTLSCLGVFATAAPIVVTSCSEDDQPKGLEIQIEGEDTVTADGGQITWNVRATYDRRSVEIKELEATVQDSNVATVEKQGNDKIIITGKTPDSTNIHIKITDSENRTTEKDFSVNVIGDVVLNVISGEGYSVVDKTITISKDAEPSADVNVNLEFDFALKSSFDASTALESTITGITFQNGSTPGKNVIMVIPIAVWTQMLPITYELKISTKQGYSGVSINSLTLSLKKENYYSFDSATPSISTSFVPSTPMMETYTKGASIWNGVINNATLQFSVSFTVSTWKACKINTATRVSEEITSTSTGVQFANGTFTVETAPTSWTFETLYTVTAIDDNGKSAQMAFMLWPTSTTIGVTTTGTPQDVKDGGLLNIDDQSGVSSVSFTKTSIVTQTPDLWVLISSNSPTPALIPTTGGVGTATIGTGLMDLNPANYSKNGEFAFAVGVNSKTQTPYALIAFAIKGTKK